MHPSEFCSLVPPVPSTLVLKTTWDTVFHAGKRAENSNNEQTSHPHITAPQKLIVFEGFIFLPKPHNWPLPFHVTFSCLLQPHAAAPLECFSKQWEECGGNHQLYGAWALYHAASFRNPSAGLWGRGCFFMNGLSAVTCTCSNHKSILKRIYVRKTV